VLLRSEIKIVEDAIEACDLWEFTKDRDFEAETAERPHHFDYQSVHYVVRAKRPLEWEGASIQAGLTCEIQVRTLLQHAYAELAHDRIYKSSNAVGTDTRRDVARSAALVETTDEIFGVVDERLEACVAEIRRLHELARTTYVERLKLQPLNDIRVSRLLLNPYLDQLKPLSHSTLVEFLGKNEFITEKIVEREPLSVLYRHPAILFVYFLVDLEPDLLWKKWPFDLQHLQMIYADMGVSTDGRF
jgi:putative GTP pyrophosphokinase